MVVHVFICPKYSNKFGLTQQRNGTNLPLNSCEGSTWHFMKTIELIPNTDLFLLPINANTLISFIERDGFCIVSTSINVDFAES